MEKQRGNADLRETKQIIYHSKGIDESYKTYFLLNLSHYVKRYGHFYDAHSPNMVMSPDPRSNFEKFLHFPNSAFNIRKSYKIYRRKTLLFRNYQPKRKYPPPPPSSAFRVTADVTLDDFQRYDLQRCSTENRSSVTSHCRDWLTYKILATLLRVFEHNSKTRNVLPLFRIRRKSFAMACYIAPIFVATPRIVEKIIDCDISLT